MIIHFLILKVVIASKSIVPTFNAYIKCLGSPAQYTTARPIATLFPGHWCMDDLTIEHNFDSQVIWVIDLFLETISIGVFTTSDRSTSGRLVQELYICTVHMRHCIVFWDLEFRFSSHLCQLWLIRDWPVVISGGNRSTRRKPPPNPKSLAKISRVVLKITSVSERDKLIYIVRP